VTNTNASAALASFAGAEPPPEHLKIDENRLREWVGNRLPGFDKPITILKFKGGQSNPTYRIETQAGAYVLRRKPPGPLRPTAHAIDREFRALQALAPTGIPIPRPHFYCTDESVIGSEFYMVDAVEGPVHWNPELPGQTPDYRRAYFTDLISTLARVHSVDVNKVGLADFGKPSNYAARNLDRWYKTFTETKAVEIPDMDWVAAALRERLPTNEPLGLIHGDYGNHNVIAAPDAPRVAAILDWEMSTLGNPLIDLAHTMRPWMEPPEPGADRPTLADKNLAAMGVPSIEENIATYTKTSGINWTDTPFYLAFAMFRYGCMVQGVLHRRKIGTNANANFAHSQERVFAIAAKARSYLAG
jgi:aminoglycoside phosphotransferase (APT) family kinase protein